MTAVIVNLRPWDQAVAGARLQAGERPSLSEMNKQMGLQREGTSLSEVRGRFRASKERTLFTDETTERTYKCLENLMVQRVESSVSDDDRKLPWIVTGKITEYQGENYLLVERAVRAR
jgi:hypothetical protein